MMKPRFSLTAAAVAFAVLYSAASLAAPAYYRKMSTWRETLKASMFAKENPGASPSRARSRPAPKPKPAGWTPVSSKIMRHKREPQLLKADISGQPYLTLIATDGGDGNGSDHSVWADAKLTTASGRKVWLDTLRPVGVKVGWKQLFAGRRRISIGRSRFERQIWAHAPSVVCYKLDPSKKYRTFEARVGIDNRARGGSVQFTIENKKVNAPPPSRGGRGGGGGGSGGPLWDQLIKDFPSFTQQIRAASDWCGRELAGALPGRARPAPEDRVLAPGARFQASPHQPLPADQVQPQRGPAPGTPQPFGSGSHHAHRLEDRQAQGESHPARQAAARLDAQPGPPLRCREGGVGQRRGWGRCRPSKRQYTALQP